MSVVAYTKGVLAADSLAYGGRYEPSPGLKRKLHKLENGDRIGLVSAVVGEPERFLTWYRKGADPDMWKGDKPDVRALVVKPTGELFLYDCSVWPSGPIEGDCYAIGSGGDYAMGAMMCGASAAGAVNVAMQLDGYCGGRIDILE